MNRFFEIVSARLFYGDHARGAVLLCNGSVIMHATRKKVNAFLKRITK